MTRKASLQEAHRAIVRSMEDLRTLEIPVPMPLRRAEALLSAHIRKIERAQNARVASVKKLEANKHQGG